MDLGCPGLAARSNICCNSHTSLVAQVAHAVYNKYLFLGKGYAKSSAHLKIVS